MGALREFFLGYHGILIAVDNLKSRFGEKAKRRQASLESQLKLHWKSAIEL